MDPIQIMAHDSHTDDLRREAQDAPRADEPGSARAWTGGRIAAVALGAALSVAALAALVVGGLLLKGGTTIDLGAHGSYETDGYALVSDAADWQTELFGTIGSVDLTVSSDGDRPVFAGLAQPRQVQSYLEEVGYTTVHEAAGTAGLAEHAGRAPAAAPESAVPWTSRATGQGTQTLRWDADSGAQVLLVMNADRSPEVSASVVSAQATLRPRPALGAAVPAAGAAGLAAAAALIVLPVRRARRT